MNSACVSITSIAKLFICCSPFQSEAYYGKSKFKFPILRTFTNGERSKSKHHIRNSFVYL